MENNLRQATNSIVIIGLLKALDVKEGSKDGVKSISMTATISSKVGDQVHENKVNFFAKENSKLYKGYKTMATEYKVEKDRVQITASLEKNRFMSNGEIIANNRIRGIFANRIEDASIADQVGGVIECVPVSVIDEMKNGEMTGRKIVKVYCPAYNSNIHDFDFIVESNLAGAFSQYYPVGCTAEMIVRVNRYAVVDTDKQEQQQQPVFFGETLPTMPNDTVTTWVNEITITGGRQPKVEGNGAYTSEEIHEMKRLNELAIEKLKSTPAQPPVTAAHAFGEDPFAGSTPGGSDPFGGTDDDMPF